jgi:inorganic pyrophosphatase
VGNSSKIWIFVAAAIGLVVVFLSLFGGDSVNWYESYVKDVKNAKGTYFVAELLKHYDKDRDFIELDAPIHLSLENVEAPSNYVFIGQDIYLPNEDLDALLDYVDDGNNAFIFTDYNPSAILDELELETDSSFDDGFYFNEAQSPGVSQSLTDPLLNVLGDSCFDYYLYGERQRRWSFVNEEDLAIVGAEKLGETKLQTNAEDYDYNYYRNKVDTLDTLISGVNYFRIQYGEGYFYFHVQPVIFCNAHLTEMENLNYVNGVFSYLNEGDILWEEHNWVFKRPYNKRYIPQGDYFSQKDSILKMILENQELKWGWYSLLIMAILFVIFNGKRKQATIRILPDYANTTLLQIQKMGYLYKDVDEYFEITQSMFENFLWFLHVKLNIDTHQESEKIINDILKVTKYDEKEIRSIFNTYKNIENWKSVTHGVFMKLHDDIEKFYGSLK